MSTLDILMAAAGTSGSSLNVSDVFSTLLYTPATASTESRINGINLAEFGGMVWSKRRDSTLNHYLADTSRGATNILIPNLTDGSTIGTRFQSFLTNGYTGVDDAGGSFVSWTFRKATKFFDVVTWTGDNTTRNISHSLGITPGMIVVKRTNTASTQGWVVWHTSTGGTNNLLLNTSTSAAALVNGRISAVTNTNFTVQAGSTNNADVNATGGTYVAYLFAHDTSADGIIQCGTFLAPSSGETTVNLGWEPQYVLMKCYQNTGGGWFIIDNMRGMVNGGNDPYLLSNSSYISETAGYNIIEPTSTGFNARSILPNPGWNYIYLAIRKPTF